MVGGKLGKGERKWGRGRDGGGEGGKGERWRGGRGHEEK
jgi:hypothetical protein